MDKERKKFSTGKKLVFSLLALLIFMIISETATRFFFKVRGRNIEEYRLYSGEKLKQKTFYGNIYPHLAFYLKPGRDVEFTEKFPLLDKPSTIKFHINSLGFRGREISVKKLPNTYRIFCLGGSTTFGNISSPDTWPEKLEKMLKAKYPTMNFEVINGGVPAYCSSDSLITFLLRALELEPDAITIMDGINDQHFWGAENFRQDYSHGRKHLEFKNTFLDFFPGSFYNSYIYSLISYRILKHWGFSGIIQMTDIKFKYPPKMDKTPGLMTLYKNLENLIVLAKYRNIDVLLSTFPYYYDEKKTPWVKKEHYIFQSKVNNLLRNLASDQNVILVDNAAMIPKEIKYFTDSVHFTGIGTSLVAENYFNAIVKEELPEKGQ